MQLRYRYCCQPTPGQRIALAQAFGCARVAWNDALAPSQRLDQQGEKYPGGGALQKLCITRAKRRQERSWLGQVSASMLRQSLRDLDQAFRNWWKSKGKSGAPGFKKRSNRQSIRICGKEFRPTEKGVRFPKVGELPLRWSRPLSAAPTSCTLIKDCAGRTFASFVVEVEHPELPANGKAIAIDLGLASLAVASDGEKIAPPKFLRSAHKGIRRLQRSLSRKVKGSGNRRKARLKLAKAHAKVADSRLDFLHQLGTRLIRENQTVVVEDLNVAGMLKNRKLARSIADAGRRMFRTLLEYKRKLHGRSVKTVSRWEPISQTCSECGQRDGRKPLSVRVWKCSSCGAEQDRDAAKNILAAGLAERLNACGAESRTSVLVSGREAGTRLNQEVQRCTA